VEENVGRGTWGDGEGEMGKGRGTWEGEGEHGNEGMRRLGECVEGGGCLGKGTWGGHEERGG
jgi:hypothetical protein